MLCAGHLLCACSFSPAGSAADTASDGGASFLDGASGDGQSRIDILYLPSEYELMGDGDLVLEDAVIDTGELTIANGDLAGSRFVPIPATDGPELAVLYVNSLTVTDGFDVSVIGNRPLAVIADTITIAGNLDGGGHSVVPGPGGELPGMGDGAGSPGVHADIYHDSGGGGGGMASAGGQGGDAGTTCGTQADGGTPGAMSDDETVSVLRGGAGGGAGAATICDPAPGGAGGGAIFLYAATSIQISGTISVGGGGGRGGDNCGGTDSGAGGGGGSGGVIVMQTPVVQHAGLLAANGGGGGGGASGPGSDGEPGLDGLASLDPATGGPDGGTYGAVGGNGATGQLAADPGGSHECDGNGGGGGGATGRIRLHTRGDVIGEGSSSPAVDLTSY